MAVLASDIDENLITGYKSIYNQYIKRILDFVLASMVLFLLSPFLFLIAVFIGAETGFAILHRAERGGYKGKMFKICKFRTMVKNADKIGGGTTALYDSRITKVCSFLRKVKLDELPNIINIVWGDMSFIGSGLELIRYTNKYKGSERLIL